MSKAILYQNEAKDITLMDIPISIARGQGLAPVAHYSELLSSEPLLQPHPSNEPKSAKAKIKLQKDNESREAVHEALRSHIIVALEEIRKIHKGKWCLPRCVEPHHQPKEASPQKRKAISVERKQEDKLLVEPDFHTFAANLNVLSRFQSVKEVIYLSPNVDSREDFLDLSTLYNTAVCNTHNRCLHMSIGRKDSFIIPPLSTFILSEIGSSIETLKQAAAELLPPRNPQAKLGQFDVIIIDPPWSNLSVKRAGHYKVDHDDNLMRLIKNSGLDQHLTQSGYVGIWITNKTASRKAAESLFRRWNVQQVEEWVWVKTTVSGETVTELDGLWRKPYEIFCLGRRKSMGDADQVGPQTSEAKVKIIAAVPDLHSRKPCLKGACHTLYILLNMGN